MDFELTAEQGALREMAHDVFAKLYAPDRLRALWNDDERDPRAWQVMAEQGLTGLLVPERHGGMAGDAVDLLVVLEEAGRSCVPEPLLETVGIAAPLLAGADSPGEWLTSIATGHLQVTVLLQGQPYAVDADVAHLLLYEADGVVRCTESFAAQRVPAEDRTRRLFRVEPSGGSVIGDSGRVHELGAFCSAAVLNGISLRLLEMSIEHATVRQQFGQPIGAFQAVKHTLASAFAMLESARAAARYAAYAIAKDLDDRATAARVAKAAAGDVAAFVNTAALQCHGGIGFTWEHDLHFWLKRGRALEHAYGSAREHRAALAAAVLD